MAIGGTDSQRLLACGRRQRFSKPGQQRQSRHGAEAEQEPVPGTPVEQLGQPAAQHRCQQRGEDHPHAHQAVGPVELGAAVAITHHGPAHGATRPGAQPLNEAAHQQRHEAWDQLDGQGAHQKHHHADKQDGATADTIRQRAVNKLGEPVRDQVTGHHRLQLAGGHVEVPRHHGNGGHIQGLGHLAHSDHQNGQKKQRIKTVPIHISVPKIIKKLPHPWQKPAEGIQKHRINQR